MKYHSHTIQCTHLKYTVQNSLAVQRLGLHALTAEGPGSIPGRGTKIPQAAWHGQKKKNTVQATQLAQSVEHETQSTQFNGF